MPARGLYLPLGHAVYADGVLIPAATVTSPHVALDSHDVIFAEDPPTERYPDLREHSAVSNGAFSGAAAPVRSRAPGAPSLWLSQSRLTRSA